MSAINKLIVARKKDLGLSYQQLADRSGMTKGHIHQLATGNANNLTVESVVRLSIALRIPAVDVFRSAMRDCEM